MSELRCRPGDIAFVVGDSECPENNGALVRVETLSTTLWPWDSRPHWNVVSLGRPLKVTEIDDDDMPTGEHGYAMEAEQPDDELRPLRPGNGEDEMLRIVGKPREVVA